AFSMDDVLTKCFEPIEIALLSDYADLSAFCLDIIQKSISIYNFSGKLYDPINRQRLFIDYLMIVISKCYEKFFSSPVVEVQLIKLLLVLITSSHSKIHGDSLMTCIRLCYNIYVCSSKPSNQTLALGALLQMISIIFQRTDCIDYDLACSNTLIYRIRDTDQNLNGESLNHSVRECLEHIVMIIDESKSIKMLYEKDSVIAFRNIARLSLKSLKDKRYSSLMENKEIQSKKLSHRLINHILTNFTSQIKQNLDYIEVLKLYH
ncbi:MAG: Brefeldin A-inhibited guanine nucleotide-exchange protein 1, partial [Paramarteilia canceri]